MKRLLIVTVLVITVYHVNSQVRIIKVQKGSVILVGEDQAILPNEQYSHYIQNHYPVRYQDQPQLEVRYPNSSNEILLALALLGVVSGMGAIILVFAEKRGKSYDYPPSMSNTFHVSGGHVDSSETNDLHDHRLYYAPGDTDMGTAREVVKMWQREEREKEQNEE